MERFQFRCRFEMRKASVGDASEHQIKRLKIGQSSHALKVAVVQLCPK